MERERERGGGGDGMSGHGREEGEGRKKWKGVQLLEMTTDQYSRFPETSPSYGGEAVGDGLHQKKSSFQSDPIEAWTPLHLPFSFLLGGASSSSSSSSSGSPPFFPLLSLSFFLFIFLGSSLLFFSSLSPHPEDGFAWMCREGGVGWLHG